MMKKHFTVRLMALMLAALMMGAAFSACSQTQQTEQTEQTQETQTEEKSEESAQATEQTKVGQWEFTDSLGRTVSFEGQIERVAPSGNMAQQCLFSIAADKMVGRAGEVAKNAEAYYGEEFVNLPVFGAFYGSKSDLNKEAVIAADPQIIIDIGEVKDGMKEELDDLQEFRSSLSKQIWKEQEQPSVHWDSCLTAKKRQTKLRTTVTRPCRMHRKSRHPFRKRSARAFIMD